MVGSCLLLGECASIIQSSSMMISSETPQMLSFLTLHNLTVSTAATGFSRFGFYPTFVINVS